MFIQAGVHEGKNCLSFLLSFLLLPGESKLWAERGPQRSPAPGDRRAILDDPGAREPRALRSGTEPDTTHSDEMTGTARPPALRPPVGLHIPSPQLAGTWI